MADKKIWIFLCLALVGICSIIEGETSFSDVGEFGLSFSPLRSNVSHNFNGNINKFVIYAFYQVNPFGHLKTTDAVFEIPSSGRLSEAGLITLNNVGIVISGKAQTIINESSN